MKVDMKRTRMRRPTVNEKAMILARIMLIIEISGGV